MATTTNFGWTTPNDTDLVKDGAAAIRTALGGVDTSFVDLKGGTTGQILSKTSATDLDFTWVTPSTSLVLLSTTTLSGTSVNITSIDQTYNNLVILGNNVTWSTGNERIYFKPNAVQASGNYSGVFGATASNNTIIQVLGSANAASNANTNFFVTINNYASTTVHKPAFFYGQNPAAATSTSNMAGAITTTSAISSIEITTVGGTATLGGTVLIYGVK
jgi:hypothetical protein